MIVLACLYLLCSTALFIFFCEAIKLDQRREYSQERAELLVELDNGMVWYFVEFILVWPVKVPFYAIKGFIRRLRKR